MSLHEDLGQIAEKLGQSEIVPTIPELSINDRLWETNDSGSSDALYEVNDKISDFQSSRNVRSNCRRHVSDFFYAMAEADNHLEMSHVRQTKKLCRWSAALGL